MFEQKFHFFSFFVAVVVRLNMGYMGGRLYTTSTFGIDDDANYSSERNPTWKMVEMWWVGENKIK